ncbi:MAG: ferredoxin [Acidimicrobiales bacterium]
MSQPDLEVVVDRDRCQGYANCLEAAPSAFELDDHDVAVPSSATFPASMRDALEAAVRRCPAAAIALVER